MQLHMQADGMKPKTLDVLMIIILAFNCFTTLGYIRNCKADVLPKYYVDDDYNYTTPGWQVDHFDSIQDAINVSFAGDRIIVYAGSYFETITISHKLDLFGEDNTITTITGSDSGDRITISAENVNISHFTIQNCGTSTYNAVINVISGNTIITDNIIQSGGKHGIYINNSSNNLIYDNRITSNIGNGLYLNHSDNNKITYNSITSNSDNGIFLYNSCNNTILNNAAIKSNSNNGIFLNETCNYNIISYSNFSENTKNGIFLNDHCDHNTISFNDIYSNSDTGIRLENSSSNTISSSIINKNSDYGIILVGSNSTIQSNTIFYNGDHGIYLFADDNNIISSNIIGNNSYDGIRLSNSTNDSIVSNEICGNSRNGMNLDFFTINNLIYNNYFHDNTYNSIDKSISKNLWNNTKTSGINKVGGPYIYGNYWDDFDESSEGASDSDGDGIADNFYTIYGSNKDSGPLLDVVSPTITSFQVSPNSQTVGAYTNISASVTDNLKVRDVYLIVTYPNNQTSNNSIFQNKTGNSYYCYKRYLAVGNYTYYISARDARNWISSSNGTFKITEVTPPSIIDNTPKTTSPSRIFIFNATVTDDIYSSPLTVKVDWYQEGNISCGNYSMIKIYGDYFEYNLSLDNSTNNLRYYFYACDNWGNSRVTASKTVSIVDASAPTIMINKYGSSSDFLPNSYTFGATVTDDNEVDEVNIEYWYENSDHLTVEMDKKTDSYYKKIIIINENPSRLYSIIHATDLSGNHNDTKKPFGNAGGPYLGVVGTKVIFNASNSFDLDGNISTYSWSFGDGTSEFGSTVSHIYSSNGNYSINLTVTDDDGNNNTVYTYALIIPIIKQTTSNLTISEIEKKYYITLDELFYSYDSDGDSIVDTFIDPNNVLKIVHTGSINISGNIVFLLSIDDETIPEFMWNSKEDTILPINSNIKGTLTYTNIDKINNRITTIVKVKKTYGWIYLEILKPDISEFGEITDLITAVKNGIEIDNDKIIRKNNNYYILDDPEIEYQFVFSYTPPKLIPPDFIPSGGTIDIDNPTIKIIFNLAAEITYADFYNTETKDTIYIISDLVTTDNITFYYTPPNNLANGEYEIWIKAKANNVEVQNSTTYLFVSYVVVEEKFDFLQLVLLLGIIGAIGVAVILIIKLKIITLESFIYIKNKKIIPFFKPLVFGPLRIDVNDEKVKKAEIYVNGKLKDTITQEPFIWNWNEPAFMKQTIETKIYDENGNTSSSGEMTFFVFNPFKFSK